MCGPQSSRRARQVQRILIIVVFLQLPLHYNAWDIICISFVFQEVSFDEAITIIEDMRVLLKKKQVAHDDKKANCITEGYTSDDKQKSLAKARKDEEAAIAYVTEAIATLKDEIAAFTASIAALDQAVAEATELRTAERAACAATMAQT